MNTRLSTAIIVMMAMLCGPRSATATNQFLPSFFLPRQGLYFLIMYKYDSLPPGNLNLYTTDSDETVKIATLNPSSQFDESFFTLAFTPHRLSLPEDGTFRGSAHVEFYDIHYPPQYTNSYSYSGDVISAHSPFSFGFDGGANAYAFGIGSSTSDLHYFFQVRLANSTAVVADTSLAQAAVAQGLWSSADAYFELDPKHNWISASALPVGPNEYYSMSVAEPGNGILLLASMTALAAWRCAGGGQFARRFRCRA